MNSTRISQAWVKVSESFSLSLTYSWHSGVMVMIPDWELAGYTNTEIFVFGKKGLV